jgi:hypothetical protein
MTEVADQLYLSYKLRGFSNMNMLRHWERLLRKFPYSQLSNTGSTFYVRAISYAEPVLFERALPDPLDPDTVLQVAKEFTGSDCAAELETKWDLWRFDGDWKLTPTRVMLSCFAAGFEDSEGDNLRVDFGPDSTFLPDPELPNALFMSQSNIKSLLHFVHEADSALAVDSRRLWTESGENFAELLQSALEKS